MTISTRIRIEEDKSGILSFIPVTTAEGFVNENEVKKTEQELKEAAELKAKKAVEDQAFLRFISHYDVVRKGASVTIRYKNRPHLATAINTFDNTQFVFDNEVAPFFGMKRFLVGATLRNMDEAHAKKIEAIQFKRDYSFPLNAQDAPNNCRAVTRAELRKFYSSDRAMYEALAELFNRAADFTPGKQEEYLSGGKVEDKICRFNPENNENDSNVTTDHLFMLGDDNQLLGSISFNVTVDEEGLVDIYFYDEVVDYHKFLSEADKQKLSHHGFLLQQANAELDELKKSVIKGKESLVKETENRSVSTSEEDAPKLLELTMKLKKFTEESNAAIATLQAKIELQEKQINAITVPAREPLMKKLFNLVGANLRKDLYDDFDLTETPEVFDQLVEDGAIRGYIRAAAGREEMYKRLGCSDQQGVPVYVIHGPRTDYAVLLDNYIKGLASQKLNQLTAAYSNAEMMSAIRYGQPTTIPVDQSVAADNVTTHNPSTFTM